VLSIDDKDLGTPARDSANLVSVEVDGRAVTVAAGTSVIRAAALADVAIPKLCATDSLRLLPPLPRRD
jgi:formate dehydrogenase major subunit